MLPPPPRSTLFPYTTLFRSNMPSMARALYTRIVGRRVLGLAEPPICERCGSVMRLQAKHVAHARLRSEEYTSELQSQSNLVCRLLLEKKKKKKNSSKSEKKT